MQLKFGDTDSSEQGYHTLGKLKCLSCKVEEKSYPINTETLIRHHFSFSLALSYQRKAGKEGGLFNTEWNRVNVSHDIYTSEKKNGLTALVFNQSRAFLSQKKTITGP